MAIVSHRYRFVFLKTRKTASGTCELVLGRHCGPQDVLVPTKDGGDVGVVEQNNSLPLSTLDAEKLRSLVRRCKRNVKRGRGPKLLRELRRARRLIQSQHSGAEHIKAAIGDETWNSYYTFCFERNPFDRLVSFYHWRIRPLSEKPSFNTFAHAVIEGELHEQQKYNAAGFSNRRHYMIDGHKVVDKICRFEELESELREVSEHLGMPWDGWLPHTKGNIRPPRDYQEYYDPDLRKRCEQAFSLEMELLGYEF